MESKKSKSGTKIVKREDRISRFCTFISNMEINEEVKITNIHEAIKVHVESVKDIIDAYEVIKDAGKIEIIRDKYGKIKRIVRVKEEDKDLYFKKEIRDWIANIGKGMDEIRKDISGLKKRGDNEK